MSQCETQPTANNDVSAEEEDTVGKRYQATKPAIVGQKTKSGHGLQTESRQ
jgi:hypothetical protein